MRPRVLLVACNYCTNRVWETDMERHLRDCHSGNAAAGSTRVGGDASASLQLVFRAWKYDSNGRKIWARDYGIRAWPLYIPASRTW